MISEQGTNIGAALATAGRCWPRARREGAGGERLPGHPAGHRRRGSRGRLGERSRGLPQGRHPRDPRGCRQHRGRPDPGRRPRRRPAGFLKDDEGNVVTTHLNLEALEKLGALGGAGTFRIGIDGLAGDRLCRELQRLGGRELEDRRVSAYQERFVWPLALAIAVLPAAVSALRPRRATARGRCCRGRCAPAFAGPASAHADLVRDGAAAAAEGRAPVRRGRLRGGPGGLRGCGRAGARRPGAQPGRRRGAVPARSVIRRPTREFERALALTDDPAICAPRPCTTAAPPPSPAAMPKRQRRPCAQPWRSIPIAAMRWPTSKSRCAGCSSSRSRTTDRTTEAGRTEARQQKQDSRSRTSRSRTSSRSRTTAEAGPAEAGPAEAGPAEAGPAEAGPAEAGPAEAGSDSSRISSSRNSSSNSQKDGAAAGVDG